MQRNGPLFPSRLIRKPHKGYTPRNLILREGIVWAPGRPTPGALGRPGLDRGIKTLQVDQKIPAITGNDRRLSRVLSS